MNNSGDLLRPLSALCAAGCCLTADKRGVVRLALWRFCALPVLHLKEKGTNDNQLQLRFAV